MPLECRLTSPRKCRSISVRIGVGIKLCDDDSIPDNVEPKALRIEGMDEESPTNTRFKQIISEFKHAMLVA